MKRAGIIILVVIAALIFINVGPVWFQRLFGYYAKIEKIVYPQWINNEEYFYVKVVNYYDADITWSTLPEGFNPFFMFRGPNATFYIYKANINKPKEQKLFKKITTKVSFSIPEVYKKVDSSEVAFRRLDNGELILLIRGRLKYLAYYMDTNGRLLRKRIFDYDFIEGASIGDISPDGEKILLNNHIKYINSGEKIFLYDWKDKWFGPARWIYKDKLVVYHFSPLDKKEHWKDTKSDVYLIDEKRENINLICSALFKKSEEAVLSSLDFAFSPDQNLLFLSKIGIYKQDGEKWQEIKDLKDMEFNLYYPDWSPDGKRLVGAIESKDIKIIEVKDLLKE